MPNTSTKGVTIVPSDYELYRRGRNITPSTNDNEPRLSLRLNSMILQDEENEDSLVDVAFDWNVEFEGEEYTVEVQERTADYMPVDPPVVLTGSAGVGGEYLEFSGLNPKSHYTARLGVQGPSDMTWGMPIRFYTRGAYVPPGTGTTGPPGDPWAPQLITLRVDNATIGTGWQTIEWDDTVAEPGLIGFNF